MYTSISTYIHIYIELLAILDAISTSAISRPQELRVLELPKLICLPGQLGVTMASQGLLACFIGRISICTAYVYILSININIYIYIVNYTF